MDEAKFYRRVKTKTILTLSLSIVMAGKVCLFSFGQQSASYIIATKVTGGGGEVAESANYMLLPGAIGQSVIGESESANYSLFAGYLYTFDNFDEEGYINFIGEVIVDLPDEAFKNTPDQRKNAFLNKLDAIFDLIDSGFYEEAMDKLQNDILAKMDGSLGGHPKNDWIIDPEAQEQVADLIQALIDYLSYLL